MPGRDKVGLVYETALIGRRVLLRPEQDHDRRVVGSLAANPRVAADVAAAPGRDGRAGEAMIVVERSSGAIVGVAAYGPMADRPAAIEVATWIAEPFWGRGYATEATQAIIDRAFLESDAPRLWCSTRVANQRARRVIEKCGFQFRETGMVRSPSSGAVPVERFVLDRRNWVSLKSWGAPPPREVGNVHDTAA